MSERCFRHHEGQRKRRGSFLSPPLALAFFFFGVQLSCDFLGPPKLKVFSQAIKTSVDTHAVVRFSVSFFQGQSEISYVCCVKFFLCGPLLALSYLTFFNAPFSQYFRYDQRRNYDYGPPRRPYYRGPPSYYDPYMDRRPPYPRDYGYPGYGGGYGYRSRSPPRSPPRYHYCFCSFPLSTAELW